MKKTLLLLLISLSSYYVHAQSAEHERDSLKLVLQNVKTDTGRVLILADLSLTYYEVKPDTMMILALQALELSRKIGFAKGEAISLNRMSNVYGLLGNYPKQLEVLLQALQINEKINNTDGKRRNLNNIGLVYSNQDEYRQALSYYFKAKVLGEEEGNKVALCIVLENIGECYLRLRMFDSATIFIQQSYNLAYQIKDFSLIGWPLCSMGEIYSATEQNTLALEYYRKSIHNLIEYKNHIRLCDAYLGMGKLFANMNNKDSALFYGKSSLEIATQKGSTFRVRDAARFLSQYSRKYNADTALFYQDIATAANDSLFSQEKQKQFQSLVFDEKIRQQEIAETQQKVKQERKRNLQYAAIALILVVFVILYLLFSHSVIANQRLIRFLGILALLIVFEFINLFIHPYLDKWTNHSISMMLGIMVSIAALLIPLHHQLEHWITHRLVEKNNKIRLMAAKKTIAKLEKNT